MSEAVEQVRNTLGSDAVIIEDRATGVTLRFLLEKGRVFEISLY